MRNFQVQGDKVIGDLHLSETTAKSPSGDLREYVESLAEEDPEAFGLSVVVDGYGAWTLADGTETPDEGFRPQGRRQSIRHCGLRRRTRWTRWTNRRPTGTGCSATRRAGWRPMCTRRLDEVFRGRRYRHWKG